MFAALPCDPGLPPWQCTGTCIGAGCRQLAPGVGVFIIRWFAPSPSTRKAFIHSSSLYNGAAINGAVGQGGRAHELPLRPVGTPAHARRHSSRSQRRHTELTHHFEFNTGRSNPPCRWDGKEGTQPAHTLAYVQRPIGVQWWTLRRVCLCADPPGTWPGSWWSSQQGGLMMSGYSGRFALQSPSARTARASAAHQHRLSPR